MRPVGGITRTAPPARGPIARGRPAPGADGTAGGGRALIAIAPLGSSDQPPRTSRRPAADFLAQLIATAQQAPQTRARRRVEPAIAIMRYRATAAEAGAPAGQHLARSC